tara:strand:- start:32847 stop:33788 length:942 start_codon:yes stop_codon:yes gene_type:complete
MPPKDYTYTGAKDANLKISEEEINPSTLETIDYAFYDFMNDKIAARSTTNEGWKKTPIVWASSERSFYSKNNKELRDIDGTIILPIISIERVSIQKNLARKGKFQGATLNFIDPYYGGRVTIARRIVSDKTNNFAVADNIKKFQDKNKQSTVNSTPGGQPYFPKRDEFGRLVKNKKIVYETISVPIPVYVTVNYSVTIRTEYLQQMNQLTTPFITLGGNINSFLIHRDGHRYETFVQSDFGFNNNASNMGDDERVYETKINFDVLGYVIGEAPNGDRPKVIKRESAVEVKMPREHVILGDIPDYTDNRGLYRE